MNEQAVIAVESQKVTDAFPEDLLALLHQYSNNAGQNSRRNPLTHLGRPISRPLCLLLPLLTAFLDLVLSKQRILVIHVPLIFHSPNEDIPKPVAKTKTGAFHQHITCKPYLRIHLQSPIASAGSKDCEEEDVAVAVCCPLC